MRSNGVCFPHTSTKSFCDAKADVGAPSQTVPLYTVLTADSLVTKPLGFKKAVQCRKKKKIIINKHLKWYQHFGELTDDVLTTIMKADYIKAEEGYNNAQVFAGRDAIRSWGAAKSLR